MGSWYLVKETRAECVDGYPALLRDMLGRANFTYQPEYAIYRRDRGQGSWAKASESNQELGWEMALRRRRANPNNLDTKDSKNETID